MGSRGNKENIKTSLRLRDFAPLRLINILEELQHAG